MKRVTVALRRMVAAVAGAVGLEGTFLLVGTGLLAAGSAHLSPAGPLFVVGGMCVLIALALVVPDRRR